MLTKPGYQTFMAKAHDYDTSGYQKSWSKIMAIRHALATYPDCKYIWYLDQDSFIMEPTRTVEEVVTEPRTLETLMIRDFPVVPPDSIIKTVVHLRGEDAGMIISQDKDGLVADSMLLKNGDWARFLTETWLDPLYRTYNFQKAERHALVSFSTQVPDTRTTSIGTFGVDGRSLMTWSRNTLCNGTQRSFPTLRWCRSGRWRRIRTSASGKSIGRGIL